MTESGGTVLVTGGTGFLGGWCIASLLERGYDVRTTVRDLAREHEVRGSVEAAGVDPGSRLTVLAADLKSDAGWADAVAGCRYVLHVASPFPPSSPRTRTSSSCPLGTAPFGSYAPRWTRASSGWR